MLSWARCDFLQRSKTIAAYFNRVRPPIRPQMLRYVHEILAVIVGGTLGSGYHNITKGDCSPRGAISHEADMLPDWREPYQTLA